MMPPSNTTSPLAPVTALGRLRHTIATVLAIEPSAVEDATSPSTAPAWDSLNHLNLVMALEQEFGLSLSTDDALAMKDVGAIRKVLARHGVDC